MTAYGWYLMKKKESGSDYEKLTDIVSMPDIGSDPEQIDITTLSDGQRRYMPGIKESSSMDFTVNHSKETFEKISELEGKELDLAIYAGFSGDFGSEVPDGHEGIWKFKGYVSIRKTSQQVNGAPQANLRVTPSSVITFE